MSDRTTKTRLLDAAERLYSEDGIEATSLRTITREARTNLAAVNYHFGSKRELTHAVFARHIAPITRERFRLLDAAEAAAGDGLMPLEDVVEALILPALNLSRDPDRGGPRFVRLMGRIYSEPTSEMSALIHEQFSETVRRFLAAFTRALPELPSEEIFWRFHFTLGSMIHILANPAKLEEMSGGHCDPHDVTAVAPRLVQYASHGFRAPTVATAQREIGGKP